jgi:hypothetical protein
MHWKAIPKHLYRPQKKDWRPVAEPGRAANLDDDAVDGAHAAAVDATGAGAPSSAKIALEPPKSSHVVDREAELILETHVDGTDRQPEVLEHGRAAQV